MALIVQKFGGTSVGSPERILAVADRIQKAHAEGHRLVVVVSAMGDTTDDLIELAHQISKNPPHREMDMLLTTGERISMALLSMALAEKKVPAMSLTGSQSGIITTHSHRRARIRRILGDRVRSALAEGKVAIVAGFQGVSETKEITTLGRGGSDTTAVALACALKADACEIYTDVDGVYSADPRQVPHARFWSKLPYDLMIELAERGAGVLHPRSVELAKRFGINVVVKNSRNEKEGTTIMDAAMEDFQVAGVTAHTGKATIKINLMRSTVISSVWNRAADAHLSILAPAFSDEKLEFFIDRDAEQDWKKCLNQLVVEGFVRDFDIDADRVPVSVVGSRFAQDGAALCDIFETLAQAGISVTMGSASALAVNMAIPRNRVEEAVQKLHERYFGAEKK